MSVRLVWVVAVLAVALVAGPVAAAGPGSDTSTTNGSASAGSHIESVYPNPLADEDAGEYVVLDFPRPTNLSTWTLTDGESDVSLSNDTVSGRVAVTAEPEAARNATDAPLLALDDSVSLANSGDAVALVHDGHEVDNTTYEDAPDAEVWNRSADGWGWEHLGTTDFAVARTDTTSARVFVLPDDPAVAVETIEAADQRVLLAGYTFSSERVARALKRAKERGVRVRVLVDDAPVGGMSERQAAALNELVVAGIPVDVIGGDWARYDYHHAKYAVVDHRALVMTENWKPSGVGGHSNRGWGAVVGSEAAEALAAVFRADDGWRDTVPWRSYRANHTFEPDDVANETYPSNFDPKTVDVDGVQVLVAPDNAERALIARIDNATRSVDVIQPAIGSRHQSFLEAAIRAARRGVRVRVLLSNAWYSEDENEAMAEWINARGETEDLPLEAKVVDPESTFEDIHAKGVVIDNDTAVVGSMNWNNNSANENREVTVVLDGEAAGAYYGRVFEADWTEDGGSGLDLGFDSPLPIGVLVAVVGVLLLGIVVARRIEFE